MARPAFVRLPLPAIPPAAAWMAPLPGSDPAALARGAAAVRTRLAATPGVAALPAAGLDIFAVPDFLSTEECAAMIALIDADVVPSTSFANAGGARRTSTTCRLAADQPQVAAVETRIATLLGLALDHSETLQGQRYEPGQQFRMHNDYFASGQPYSAIVAEEGGQRTWTAMIYLDEPARGGSTHFPYAAIACLPRAGMLLAWHNLGRDGQAIRAAHHEGAVVEEGVKHILTKWFRERRWLGSDRSDAMRR